MAKRDKKISQDYDQLLGPEHEMDPGKLSSHRINIHRALKSDEFSKLKDSIAEHGQTRPVILWQGDVIAGWHTTKACLALGRKVIVKELDGRVSEDDAIRICDRDNFAGRQYDRERRQEFLERRFHKLIDEERRGGSVGRAGGKNVAVTIAQATGLPLGTINRDLADIRRTRKSEVRYEWRELEPDEKRTAREWAREAASLVKRLDQIKALAKDVPGGWKRVWEEFGPK